MNTNEVTKEQPLKFNIDKLDNDSVNQVVGRQGDGYQKTVDVQLLAEDKPYDLSKTNLIGFKGIKPDHTVMVDYDHAKITDALNGIFTYQFESNCFSVVGDYEDAYFTVIGWDGTVDSTNSFKIKVIQNLVDQTITSEDYVSPIKKITDFARHKTQDVSDSLDNLLASSKATLDSFINGATTKITSFVSDSQSKLDSLFQKNQDDLDAAKKANTDALNQFVKSSGDQLNQSHTDEQAALAGFNQNAQAALNKFNGDANSLLSNLELDSRNYWLNTYKPITIVGQNIANQNSSDSSLPISVGNLAKMGLNTNSVLFISYDYEATGTAIAGKLRLGFNQSPWELVGVDDLSVNSTGHVALAVKISDHPEMLTNGITNGRIRLDNVSTTTTVKISNMKLAISSRDTGYSLAPEDIVNAMITIVKA